MVIPPYSFSKWSFSAKNACVRIFARNACMLLITLSSSGRLNIIPRTSCLHFLMSSLGSEVVSAPMLATLRCYRSFLGQLAL